MSFLGHALESVWDGTSARGELFLPTVFPPILANWQIHCLYNTVSSDGSNSDREDVAQVLSFGIQRTRKDLNVGFTISYKQIGAPTVLQFSPHSTDWNDIESNVDHWRTPSPTFVAQDQTRTSEDLVEEEDEEDGYIVEPSDEQQKILLKSLNTVTRYLKKQLTTFRETAGKVVRSCHTHLKNLGMSLHKAMAKMCPDHDHGQENEDHVSTFETASSSTTNHPLLSSPDRLIEALPPAQTRSIHTPTASPTASSPTDSAFPSSTPSLSPISPPPTTATHFLKLVSIAFLLFSLLTWIIIYIRDPRRRADRAARREERHNKHLYRRAAWRHWFQTRICALRHRGCPRSRGTGTCETWDEKRSRVLEQEAILEAVTQHHISTLRHATRPHRQRHVNSMAAAEEGRNDFLYDSESESSERRRRRQSMCTLPGYESEGTLPPGYTTVVEDTPDSSIVSTSPRISQDGLGTLMGSEIEDGKSIEDFSLNAINPAAPRLGRIY